MPSGHNFLVIVDYYSRYVEVEVMNKTDSAETIRRLRTIFARFGLPISITSDNGRQFISDEFRTFCDINKIQLITTSPDWLQMNGEMERQNVSILKRMIQPEHRSKLYGRFARIPADVPINTTFHHIENSSRTTIWQKHPRQTSKHLGTVGKRRRTG